MDTGEEKVGMKWDLKQLSAGGGGVLLLLFFFQEKGLDLVNDKQLAQNQVVIEKTVNNAQRIDKLEQTVESLQKKRDSDFKDLREQIRSEIGSVRSLLEIAARDRWTRTEHTAFSNSIEQRISRLEERIEYLKTKAR